MYETITVDRTDGRATLTLDRPEKLNAMNGTMFEELADALDSFESDTPDVLTVRGAGGNFSAGVDMTPVPEWAEQRPLETFTTLRGVHDVLRGFESLGAPIVAALEGHVLGGALELAVACDIRVAHPGASFGLPEANVGLAMDLGGPQKLPGIVGEGLTKYLVMTGRSIDAERAYSAGLVEELASDDADFEDRLTALQDDLAEKPSYIHAFAKEQVHSVRPQNLEEAMDQALFHAISAYKEPETKAQVREFFE